MSLVSLLVLTLTGYSWAAVEGFLEGVVSVDVLSDGAGGDKPADGSRDILLVGMDSRTDAKGNPLPQELLRKLNAGSPDGVLNTDSLILLHIPNDGGKAVAISMPRDSYVEIPGYGKHKINSAYGRGKVDKEDELKQSGVTDAKERDVRSNEAGAETLIKTVEGLTGRTIDNYASVNLLGFYEITEAIGGVEVCLKDAVDDPLSGANFAAGKQTISGAKALAFVRQRHGLLRGDIDRVVRQQVFMAGLARKVISAGTLANPQKFGNLKTAIEKSVVLNEGWNIVDFANQMSDLTGGQIQFHTIPFGNMGLDTPDGSAVEVDPWQVQQFVDGLTGSSGQQKLTAEDKAANAKTTVTVLNAAGVTGMAGDISDRLKQAGFTAGQVANAASRETTVVRHAPGETDAAHRVAAALEGPAQIEEDPTLTAGTMTVVLGADFPPPQDTAGTGGGTQAGAQPAAQSGGQAKPQQPEPDPADDAITADGVTCVN
ncbi:MAG: LytR family transcriptional regulator [Actinophytocola sp.]|nr:LytR family transcriptional regulator [Actinophytocola sp.]